jgi:hypothetical protein
LGNGDTNQRMLKARVAFDGKPVTYSAAMAKLAPGVIHLVALAKIPGLMPNISDDHLWAELSGPRYTTPLLRSWTAWLKEAMASSPSSPATFAWWGFLAYSITLRKQGFFR